jgi:hypothetical protein
LTPNKECDAAIMARYRIQRQPGKEKISLSTNSPYGIRSGIGKITIALIVLATLVGISIAGYAVISSISTCLEDSICVSVINQSWVSFGGLFVNPVTVNATGSASFNFEVQNTSSNQSMILSGLGAFVSISPKTSAIFIQPNPQNVPPVSYQGTTSPLDFNLQTTNAPNGDYTITIEIMNESHAVTTVTVQLTVQ